MLCWRRCPFAHHPAAPSAGDPLGVCELMLGNKRAADLTADSMVQALLVPTTLFLQLVSTVPGISTRAWQATAAQLAAEHHHILGEHKQLAPLNMFFRSVSSSLEILGVLGHYVIFRELLG